MSVLNDVIAATGLTPTTLAVAATIILLAAFMRGVTGFGFAIAAVPLMSLVMEPRLAIGVSILLPLPSGLMDLGKAWPASHRRVMPRLIGGAVIGTPIGMLLLGVIAPDLQRVIVAAAAFYALAAVYLFKDPDKLGLLGRPTAAGLGAGLLNGLAGMPGPPVVAYILTQPLPAAMARASMIVFFLATGVVGGLSGVATGVITPGSALASLLCLPLFILGNGAGRRLFEASQAGVYRKAGLVLLVIGATSAGWKGVAGFL
ncbi:sulfite exporter TauE/SafE family protein [Phenylobacterium immobile]|uniref:sulfite exporter TauE/SafE family protein n=1 Tax=Phenylobacterium immobile TaxID=21 RepID=UPI000ABEA1D6|nr:sulfite exporter TauE/SafE family protein [Phenylobacterium immobile]